MVEAQRIACSNDGWFTMSFTAKSDSFESPATSTIWRGQQQIIDLANDPIPEGQSFQPCVSIDADDRSEPPPPPAGITFRMNGRTAFYHVTGTIWTWETQFSALGDPSGRPSLPGFPANVPLNVLPYHNWDNQISAAAVLTCAPTSDSDVVAVCNWAKDNGYQVRPRGVMHGWSPLTLAAHPDPKAKVLLVDLTKSLCQASLLPPSGGLPSRVLVQTGKTMLHLLQYLEAQPGGSGSAPGYSFPHTPAPGNLTVGGVLAIGAHGTAVPTPPHDDFAASYGSMSNQILAFTAVVTDPTSATPDQYALRTFKRSDADAKVFLAHLGRALLVDVTLQVIDNYNLRCQSLTNFSEDVLFAAPSTATPIPKDSFADYLERFGRVEVIWFRPGTNPWLHVWSVEANKPAASTAVHEPYNYPFADHVPDALQQFLKMLLNGVPSATPLFGDMAAAVTAAGLDGKDVLGQTIYPPSRDIWGPSKNSLLYIQDTTLQVTANGYALQMKKADVQQAVYDFSNKFRTLLATYEANDKYPINSAVELRVTSLDDPARVGASAGASAESPLMSALSFDDVAKQNGWDVALWVDVLTIPGSGYSNAFYAELEAWVVERFSGTTARALPEWSKGWAYSTDQGAWTDARFLDHIRQAFTAGRTDQNNWAFAVDALNKYDKSCLFTNPLLRQLFTP
jgi:FAD/FMN-containing dehydrogenase